MPATNAATPLAQTGQCRFNDLPANDYLDRRADLLRAFQVCRAQSLERAAPLSAEDQLLQSMPDASPTKWHLAHTTWFFESFILAEFSAGYTPCDPGYHHLFNSYYNGVGTPFSRPRRGLLSRPSLETVLHYRRQVDERMRSLLGSCADAKFSELAPLLVLGLNHEQQHQELILTDIKHALSHNPGLPAYADGEAGDHAEGAGGWLTFDGPRTHRVGYQGAGFCFDNEFPAHPVLLAPFEVANRAVSNREWLEFMQDGGYREPLLWLSDGWAWRCENQVEQPLYWLGEAGDWRHFTLRGACALALDAPVCHVSFYEAEAFARWRGLRLPTEFEWETAARAHPALLLPAAGNGAAAEREFESTWQWTSSAYAPYPGYRPAAGAVGEYNGKFMVNQVVLRGASCATAPGHSRPSYRNFFYPSARWQFSGLRLARDA